MFQEASRSFSATAVPWWLVLIQGIAAVIVGLLLLFDPLLTTLILVQILGLYWLVSGMLSLVRMFIDRSDWGWKLFMGIIGILAGLAVVRHPLWATILVPATLIIILAVQGLVSGAVSLYLSFRGGGVGEAVIGVLQIVISLVLLFSPLIAALALPYVFGVLAIVVGVGAIVFAFRLRGRVQVAGQPAAT